MCAHEVAVRAHEIALRDLIEDDSPSPAPQIAADRAALDRSGTVVELHRLRRIDASAVGARPVGLQGQQPGVSRALSGPISFDALDASTHVARVVQLRAACLADRLMPITLATAAMEVRERLRSTTTADIASPMNSTTVRYQKQ